MTQGSAPAGIGVVPAVRIQVSGRPFADLIAKYGCEHIETELVYQPVEIARAIAKIAYGFAVLRLGLERISEAYVLPAILGQTDSVGQWVGCDVGDPVCSSTGLHAIMLKPPVQSEIHVFVRLFAQFGAPEYHVVVGRIKRSN